jgi:hypothetical protein
LLKHEEKFQKILKGQSEGVNRRADNTLAKRQNNGSQKTCTPYSKLKIDQHKPKQKTLR